LGKKGCWGCKKVLALKMKVSPQQITKIVSSKVISFEQNLTSIVTPMCIAKAIAC
jgi:hypothetical protein